MEGERKGRCVTNSFLSIAGEKQGQVLERQHNCEMGVENGGSSILISLLTPIIMKDFRIFALFLLRAA